MNGQAPIHPLDPAARAAIADAEALVALSHGSNLDPILDALDDRLRTARGAIDRRAIAGLRPELRSCIEACDRDHRSVRQLAAQLLCSLEPATLTVLAAAARQGPTTLVPALATAMFARVTDRAWPVCSALAALIAVEGFATMCGPHHPEQLRPPLAPAS